jgi:hypothetical protein
MSTISAGTTVGTALVQSGDTTGNLVFKTGSSATTALTISGTDQSITVAGGLNLGAPVAIASGGTGQTTRQNAMDALAGAVTNGLYLRGDGTDVVMGTLRAGDMTGTLAVSNGGTGQSTLTANHVLLGNGTSGFQAVDPGSSGNVLTSNGTTWTSSAPSGGVTSLNGQTGAITNTAFNAIGSYSVGVPNVANATYSAGATASGSAIFVQNSSTPYGTFASNSGTISNLSKTGTWRCVNTSVNSATDPCLGTHTNRPNLWVRIS